MKKIIALLLIAVMAIGVVGCGKEEDTKKFIIGTDTTFAPFEFEQGGEMIGIDIDLIRQIAKDQGFEIELKSLGFNAAVAALEANQVDGVIAGMSITDARKEKFDFSEAYYDSGVVMGINKDNNEITSYEDLKGKTVAIKNGTEGATFAESIAEQYEFELKYFEESAPMYDDVENNNAAACFEDYPVLGYTISQGKGLKIVTDKEKGSSYGFAVSKGKNEDLLKMFNDGLAKLKDSGEYEEILDKYIAKGN